MYEDIHSDTAVTDAIKVETDVETNGQCVNEVENEGAPEFILHKKEPPKKTDVVGQIISALSPLILLFSIILVIAINLINSPVTPPLVPGISPPSSDASVIMSEPSEEYLPSYKEGSAPSQISSSSVGAVLVKYGTGDLKSGTVIAAKNPDAPVAIASMTKIMTLIVACDHITNEAALLNEMITLTYSKDKLLDVRDNKNYNMAFINDKDHHSERVYLIDALYGLILESGADCAYGLAEALVGSEEEFVEKMNEKALALGMTKTTFTNCVGKHDAKNNVSTVRDVAAMLAYALDNELCRQILTASSWVCHGSYKDSTVDSLVHETLRGKLGSSLQCDSVTILGGKSGSEIDDKHSPYYCLASYAQGNDGAYYICITAEGSNSYNDTISIYKNHAK